MSLALLRLLPPSSFPTNTLSPGTALSLASIALPDWITWHAPSPHPSDPPSQPVHYTYGLQARCSSLSSPTSTPSCHPFPRAHDCTTSPTFCSLWRTAGFSASLAVVLELACCVALLLVLLGGKQRRARGWRVVLPLVAAAVVAQAVGVGVVAGLWERDARFEMDGWALGRAWGVAAAGLGGLVGAGMGLGVGVRWAAEEGGYELIPEGR